MPERLDELRRQRALVQEQLAWLDREIAALAPSAESPPSSAPVAPTETVREIPATASAGIEPDFREYEPDPAATRQAAQRGCLLYAAAAFVLLALLTFGILFFVYRDHPLFVADRSADRVENPK